MIKKGCAIASVVLLALFAVYFKLLYPRIELFPAILLALFGALGLVMLVSQLKEVVFGSADSGALKRAEQGLPLEDGKVEAVWGPIEPLGAALEAPFSGQACVAYEYDAKKPDGENSDGESTPGGSAISGFALTPSVIRSSRGDARLLGFSLLEKFEAKHLAGDETARARANAWLAQTPFQEMGLTKIGSMLSSMDDAMADDDGTVRKDWRMGKAGEVSLDGCALEEKVIAPGDTITALGVWDATRGGLVPKYRGKSTIVRLTPGGGAAMMAYAQKRPWGMLAFAIVWSGFVHAFIYMVLRFAPK